jgi:hypothetical protein
MAIIRCQIVVLIETAVLLFSWLQFFFLHTREIDVSKHVLLHTDWLPLRKTCCSPSLSLNPRPKDGGRGHRVGRAISWAIKGLLASPRCQLLIIRTLGGITGWPLWPTGGGTYGGGVLVYPLCNQLHAWFQSKRLLSLFLFTHFCPSCTA